MTLEPRLYRKNPVVIEAMRLDDDAHVQAAWDWIASLGGNAYITREGRLSIRTMEGTMEASTGDYVIRGVKGEFYPCKPDIFQETYSDG